ncbi:MAG: helix-turn-helix domain-containing protein [Cellulosilyticaceae bacterium]
MDIGKNIKKLREAKQLTQEQLGKLLNVSHQAVSKWENGVTLPDIAILSELGKVLEVLVDDLLKDEIDPYESYAKRLFGVYGESRTMENFLRAEEEYRKLVESGKCTNKELSDYGYLYHHHMHDCKKKAFEIYNKVIELEKESKSKVYYNTLKIYVSLQTQLGQYEQAMALCKQLFEEDKESVEVYDLMLQIYSSTGKYEEGLAFAKEAMIKFPNESDIVGYVGEFYEYLEQYEEAFKYWDKALELSQQYIHWMFSKVFCYQKLGRKSDELNQWKEIVKWLEVKGLKIPADNHRQNIIRLEEELAENRIREEN